MSVDSIGLERDTTKVIVSGATGNVTSPIVALPEKPLEAQNLAVTIRLTHGTISAITVAVKLSLDGVFFTSEGSSTSTTGDIIYIVGKPAKFLQVAVSGFSGSGSPAFDIEVLAV